MTAMDWAIALGALALIAFVLWFFLGPRAPVAVAATTAGGPVDVEVRVEGGYSPAVIEVPSGARVRMTFDRREDNPCSDELVIADFGIRRALPAFAKTVVELTVTPGRHEFTCGMGMLHGAIVGK